MKESMKESDNNLYSQDQNNYFDTKHLRSDLKKRSLRSGAISITSQIVLFGLQLLSTMVLARLLNPDDFGLIAMVVAITGFVEMFKDLGLSMATIQKAEIKHSQVSNLFWINVIVSSAFALILAMSAPIISWFYSEPRLIWITIALAATFILSGLTVQHMAILHRQMRFMAVAIIRIAAMGFSILVGIIMAWYGAEYWSLVGMSAALQLGYLVLSWVFCGWRPGLPVREAGILSMVKFGGHITAFNMINYFARNFDNILLGRFCGATVLGLYSKAYGIMMLPINQVRRPLDIVSIPALSHIQNDPLRYKRYYTKLITIIAFITMPLMVFLFVHADQVIRLLLGMKWVEATDIFKVLCINAFIQPVAGTTGLVLISLGQSKRFFTIGSICSIIIVISFILGLPWGAIGVAVAYTIATYVLLIPSLWYTYKKTPISVSDFFMAIFQPVIASIVMGFIIYVIRSYLTNMADILSIFCSFIIAFLLYLMAVIALPSGLQLLKEFFSYRFFLFRTNSSK
jgi:PST family polysaccharide transporter